MEYTNVLVSGQQRQTEQPAIQAHQFLVLREFFSQTSLHCIFADSLRIVEPATDVLCIGADNSCQCIAQGTLIISDHSHTFKWQTLPYGSEKIHVNSRLSSYYSFNANGYFFSRPKQPSGAESELSVRVLYLLFEILDYIFKLFKYLNITIDCYCHSYELLNFKNQSMLLCYFNGVNVMSIVVMCCHMCFVMFLVVLSV